MKQLPDATGKWWYTTDSYKIATGFEKLQSQYHHPGHLKPVADQRKRRRRFGGSDCSRDSGLLPATT